MPYIQDKRGKTIMGTAFLLAIPFLIFGIALMVHAAEMDARYGPIIKDWYESDPSYWPEGAGFTIGGWMLEIACCQIMGILMIAVAICLMVGALFWFSTERKRKNNSTNVTS